MSTKHELYMLAPRDIFPLLKMYVLVPASKIVVKTVIPQCLNLPSVVLVLAIITQYYRSICEESCQCFFKAVSVVLMPGLWIVLICCVFQF